MFLLEVDRVLKPGGYFVLTSSASQPYGSSLSMKESMSTETSPMEELTEKICWTLLAQKYETSIWQKTVDSNCHTSR